MMKIQTFPKYTCLSEENASYLKELKDFVSQSSYLPSHHIYPPCGLLNDPNGLSYYEGEYHIFYQWYPYAPTHGMKHWAHVKGNDLRSFTWCEEGLIPDQPYETHGCYSGNAIEKDGLLYLFYTANYKTETGKIAKQALAVMDAQGHIEKYHRNPIIDGSPEGFSGEIRDPFVFMKNDTYYMLLGAKSLDNKGYFLLYQSEDILHWKYQGILDVDVDCGYMVECPAYLQVDGKDVLCYSPMGKTPEDDRYQNRFSSLYVVGTLDIEKRKFLVEYVQEIDYGFDFYAPQMFYGKHKLPLMYGWFGCGEQPLYSDQDMWKHALTLPRTLQIKENRLYAYPPEEAIDAFPTYEVSTEHIVIPGRVFHLHLKISSLSDYEIHIGEEDDYWSLSYHKETAKFVLDRSHLQIPVDEELGCKRSGTIDIDGDIECDIFVDNSFVEIFVNKGQYSFSARVFPTQTDTMITIIK